MPTNNTENIYSTEFENDPNPIPSSKVGYDNTESGLEATTVQGAIDELDSKIKASDEASEITYDNTESELEATNVQSAIDELNTKIEASDEASEITYDNTESELEATNVQGAIDEILSLEKLGYKLVGEDTITSQNVTSWSTFVSEKTDLDEAAIKSSIGDDEAYLILGILFGSLVTHMDIPTLVTKQTTSHFLAHFYSALVATDTAFGQWIISRGNPRYFSVKTNEMTPTLYKDDATAMAVKYHFLKFKKEITQ